MTAAHRESAILVGVSRRRDDRHDLEEHLEELGRLAETAGAATAGVLIQDRGQLTSATLLRRGKVEELKTLVEQTGAGLAIFDDDLSPAQVRNLETELEITVLDRSALILDIFARRARSREARTQVELAQLRYLLPRLTRQWTHLSRQAGGIGQRGVGETQLETDRRLIRTRIARLAAELGTIESDRRERRKSRVALPRVALVGYTNAGKSTFMNLLTGARTLVEDRLFATLDPLVRRAATAGGPDYLLIDTVGFIRKLPHHLVASFRSTLEEAADADLLVHVVDATSEAIEDHLVTTRETLDSLGLGDRPVLLVFNKIDRAPRGAVERLLAAFPGAVAASALDPADGRRVSEAIVAALGHGPLEETVSVAAGDTATLSALFRLVRVVGTDVQDGRLEVRYRVRREDRERVARILAAAAGPGDLRPRAAANLRGSRRTTAAPRPRAAKRSARAARRPAPARAGRRVS
ncbi:MAG TPA: GTPase HflX [Dongiaceae bacterium]|nr:GTPase HflX [Dongiaceae bacterium]